MQFHVRNWSICKLYCFCLFEIIVEEAHNNPKYLEGLYIKLNPRQGNLYSNYLIPPSGLFMIFLVNSSI
jgi:hypothetical protein